MHLGFDIISNTVGEVFTAQDLTTQVVTAIDVVANPRESATIDVVSVTVCLTSNVCLGMS